MRTEDSYIEQYSKLREVKNLADSIIEIVNAARREALEEAMKDYIKQIAVDFAWENKHGLNSKDGYQSWLKKFDEWFTENNFWQRKISNTLKELK